MTQEEQLEQVASDITALLDANGGTDEVVQQVLRACRHAWCSGFASAIAYVVASNYICIDAVLFTVVCRVDQA
jgi:hypothetical protein